MHSRRLACFLLGVWLAGGLFMAWVATQNFRSIDRLLEQPNPSASLDVKTLTPAATRLLLRYQASEQNRFYFESWETVQVVLAAFIFFFFLFATGEGKFSLVVLLAMLIMVIVQRFLLTPELTARGRNLDFVPAAIVNSERVKFNVLHKAYVVMEVVKWALTVLLVTRLVIGSRRRQSGKDIRQELDLINKANYGHIDR